jgi:GT2 family glycosyltransferase
MIVATVIVPTVGRPERLERLLGALAAQELSPRQFEVVVAIDGTHAASVHVLEQWRGRLPNLHWSDSAQRRGPAAARNRAWRMAAAPIIAMTDDDCEPTPRWLPELLAAFERESDLGVVFGRTVTDADRLTPFSHYVENHRGEGHQTCNSAYRRVLLEQLGGFDERFPAAYLEDTDLYCRALLITRVGFEPAALVYHPPREATVRDLARSAARFESDFIFFAKDPDLYRARHEQKGPFRTVLWDVSIKYTAKQLLRSFAHVRKNPLLVARFILGMALFDLHLWSRLPVYWLRYSSHIVPRDRM